MYGSLITKFAACHTPDESAEIEALREELGVKVSPISELIAYDSSSFSKTRLITRRAINSGRYGYTAAPFFLLGATRAKMSDVRLSQVQVYAARVEAVIGIAELQKRLANPDEYTDERILRFSGHKRINKYSDHYEFDFIPGPVMGRIQAAQGTAALKSALTL